MDTLAGLKENVIVGHLIPAGTGLREYENLIVGDMSEFQRKYGKNGAGAEETSGAMVRERD
jgi:DNA-directed RNA polymerase subunit beta'